MDVGSASSSAPIDLSMDAAAAPVSTSLLSILDKMLESKIESAMEALTGKLLEATALQIRGVVQSGPHSGRSSGLKAKKRSNQFQGASSPPQSQSFTTITRITAMAPISLQKQFLSY